MWGGVGAAKHGGVSPVYRLLLYSLKTTISTRRKVHTL